MPRLDIDRQKEFEPKRMEYAIEKLGELGITATSVSDNELEFEWKGNTIKLWPYSGWHSGKGIKPGRGIEKLLNQLKNK
jgi:hypothetical protein